MWQPGVVRPVLRRRLKPVDDWAVARTGAKDQVVRSDEFDADPEQRRRARRLCEDFLLVRRSDDGLNAAHLARVERMLWRALVELRAELPVRTALRQAENRVGLAAAVAQRTRELAAVDRRIDEFAAALRVLADEVDPPTLRHLAALDVL
jgi:hypothetical protein